MEEEGTQQEKEVESCTTNQHLATMVTRIPDYLPNADALVHSAECLKY